MSSDIEHYLQHSHGDRRIFVSGNVVGKTKGLLIYSPHISEYILNNGLAYSALALALARFTWILSKHCEQ